MTERPRRERADDAIAAFGRRLAEAREAAGMTQAQVAERLGTNLPNYQRIEHGLQNVTLTTIVRLGGVLSVEPATLLTAPRSPDIRAPGRPKRPEPI